MKYLRIILGVYAVFCILSAILIFITSKSGLSYFLIGYLLINATVIIAGSLFERSKYKPKSNTKEGWQQTGERFIDHGTGELMEVFYNPKTGERNYQKVNPK